MPKLIAKTIEGEQNEWEIYDNFVMKSLSSENLYRYSARFMLFLKMLKPGVKYRWFSWSGDNYEDCFSLDTTATRGVTIDFYGFDPVKCKECGFETELKVCPNCGEWQS